MFSESRIAASLMAPWSRPENIVGVTKNEEMKAKAKINREAIKSSREILKDIFFPMICQKRNPTSTEKAARMIHAQKKFPRAIEKAIHPKNTQIEEKTAKAK